MKIYVRASDDVKKLTKNSRYKMRHDIAAKLSDELHNIQQVGKSLGTSFNTEVTISPKGVVSIRFYFIESGGVAPETSTEAWNIVKLVIDKFDPQHHIFTGKRRAWLNGDRGMTWWTIDAEIDPNYIR